MNTVILLIIASIIFIYNVDFCLCGEATITGEVQCRNGNKTEGFVQLVDKYLFGSISKNKGDPVYFKESGDFQLNNNKINDRDRMYLEIHYKCGDVDGVERFEELQKLNKNTSNQYNSTYKIPDTIIVPKIE